MARRIRLLCRKSHYRMRTRIYYDLMPHYAQMVLCLALRVAAIVPRSSPLFRRSLSRAVGHTHKYSYNCFRQKQIHDEHYIVCVFMTWVTILKLPLSPQFLVKTVISDFVVDEAQLRDELRSVSTTSGAQFVMIHGMLQMLQLSVPSLDFLQKVVLSIH